MKPAKTSAIVTCHNYGRYLITCLESLFAQTRPFDEIILVDDDSNDMTFGIWQTHYQGRVRYERVRFRSQTPVRNHGFNMSNGDFIVFVDADDWLEPDFHKKMIEPLLNDPGLAFSYCGIRFWCEGKDIAWFDSPEHVMIPFNPVRLWQGNYCSQTSIVRREAWSAREHLFGYKLENGRFYGEDWDHWLYLAFKGWQGALVPDRLLNYRIHAHSNSRPVLENKERVAEIKWTIQKKYLNYELTLIFFYTGQACWQECGDYLEKLVLPVRTQVLFVYGYRGVLRPEDLQSLATKFYKIPDDGKSLDEWTKTAINTVQAEARGQKILFLSDHVFYGHDIYERLNKGLQNKRADIFSANQTHPFLRRPQAWRAVRGDPHHGGIYAVPLSRKPRRVFAAGLAGTLMTAENFHATAFHIERIYPGPVYIFTEYLAGFSAWLRTARWFADGSIRPMKIRKTSDSDGWPAVSIVVPVKDDRRGVQALLQSFEALDYPRERLDILIVDNGSRRPLSDLADRYPDVRFLTEEGRGSYAARNRGIGESRHALIAFTDADCEVTRSWLKDLVHCILRNPQAGAVSGPNLPLNPDCWLSRLSRRVGDHENFAGSTDMPPYAITMNVLYRREVFEALGFFDDRQISGSDTDMAWRMQRSGRWQLEQLTDRGLVYHRDAAGWVSYIRRALRIGHGHYGINQKFPEYLPAFLHWVPGSAAEIILHFLKKIRAWEKQTSPENKMPRRIEYYFLEFRRMLQKQGYLKNQRECLQKDCRNQAPFIFFGQQPFEIKTEMYAKLRHAAEAGYRVMHVDPRDPAYTLTRSWLYTLCGFTGVWFWRPGLASIGLWQMTPGIQKPFLSALNRYLNARRIRKALKIRKGERVYLCGGLPEEELGNWVKAFRGHEIVLNEQPVLSELSFVTAPAVGCLAVEVNELFDLDAYAAAARISPWPVMIVGKIKDTLLPKARRLALENNNLHFIETAALDEIQRRLALAVYILKPESAAQIPDVILTAVRKGLPAIISGGQWPEPCEGVTVVDGEPDLTLALRRHFVAPLWPLRSNVLETKAEELSLNS